MLDRLFTITQIWIKPGHVALRYFSVEIFKRIISFKNIVTL